MREIKFRAWDKSSNTRVNTDTYGITFSGETLSYVHGEGYCADGDEFIIEQFTGLLDKNGKEIYEGDILLADDGGDWFPEEYDEEKDEYIPIGKYFVFWDGGTAGWGIRELDGSVVDLELVPFCMDAQWEVIGNIHESPELLQ